MKSIIIFKQDGNRSVGIWEESDGEFLAMTFTVSKRFKTERGARNWLARRGYEEIIIDQLPTPHAA